MKKLNKIISILISYTLIFMPLHAADLQIDSTTNTTLDSARNGVPIINIANPNSRGLSHNKFNEYNVAKEGLILNNSRDTTVNTQLGGYIYGNSNLSSNARVILNEVTSTSRSQLNGYTEVAGQRADLVIANPNGLSINGAGFINTSNVTLTTGTPLINNGAINSYNILGGDISIEGDGLDTSTQDSTHIYTHYLKVNAAIHAQNLDIKLGRLDSSALGGMYANRISLVGTEQGLGVNLPPEVLASSGDITITNDGMISLQKITAKDDITVQSNSDIELNANAYATNITLDAKDKITNSGNLSSRDRLNISSTQLNNKKKILAGMNEDSSINNSGILKIDTETLINSGSIQSTNISDIKTKTLNNTKDITASNTLNITSTDLTTSGGEISATNLEITTDTLTSTDTNILVVEDLTLKAAVSIDNGGNIQANETLDIKTATLNNTNSLIANDMIVNADSVNNYKAMNASNSLTVTSQNIINRDTISSSNLLKLDVSNKIDNKNAQILSLNKLELTSKELDNRDGRIVSNNTLDIQTTQTIINTDGVIKSNKDSNIVTSHIDNTNGSIQSVNNLTLNTNTIDLDSSNIYAGNDLTLTLDALDNIASSSIEAGHHLTVNASSHIKNYSDLLSNGFITLTTNGTLTNSKTISSAYGLNISADSLLNDATISGGTGINKITIVNDIENNSRVSSVENLEVSAKNITNDGFFNAGQDLSITSDNLTNNKTLFSANDMFLYTNDTLRNSEDANIFAINNLTMSANSSNDKTEEIINDKANIQTYEGDINIWANQFINQGTSNISYTTYYYNLGDGKEYTNLDDAKTLNLSFSGDKRSRSSSANSNWAKTARNKLEIQAPLLYDEVQGAIANTTFMAIETRLDNSATTTDPSRLESGNNLNIHVDKFLNKDATVVASNNIVLDIKNEFLNTPSKESPKVSDYKYSVSTSTKRSRSGSGYKYRTSSTAKYITLSDTEDATATSLVQAGGSISVINGKFVNDGSINRNTSFTPTQKTEQTDTTSSTRTASLETIDTLNTQTVEAENEIINSNTVQIPDITVPTDNYGLFVRSTNPNSNYLIETNPEFALYENFISSGYMMQHIDFNPDMAIRNVGDAFYENTLIRDSIFAQTGRRYLNNDLTNNYAQYKYLMDNAIEVSEGLELSPGKSLSKEQINSLTKDIVWMEEQIVQGERVLVPVVYIANLQRFEIQDAKIIAGKNIDLDVESLENSGTMIAGSQMDINARDSIVNSSGLISADEDMKLLAKNNITNTSGTIKAKNIDITSTDGSIINQRATSQSNFKANKISDSTTMVGAASNITATNFITLNAAKKIEVIGSNLNAKDINLNAKSIDIITTVAKKDFFAGDSKNYTKEQSTTHLASNLNADNIKINSTDTTSIIGSNLNATENLNVKAKEIDVLAVNNTTYSESKTSSSGFLKKSTTATKKATSTNQASSLSGANVELTTTQEDINVIGSNLEAKETLALNSTKGISINAGYDGSMDESHTKKSGFFSGGALYSESEDLEGQITKTAVNSNLNASNVQLNANNSINAVGVDIDVKESLNASAQDISILNATNTNETYSKHKKIEVSLADAAKTLINPIGAMEVKDGKASFTLATATYDDETKVTKTTTVASSNINANKINLNATSKETDKGNILVQGSNLNAEEEIGLTASNNITIKEAKETTDITSKETHGKAELKLTVKNEYVQIKYSLEAVKEATSSLKQTKTDYSDYKKELSSQTDKLAQLKQDYKNGIGFIELGDVEEFEELVSDLKEDDAYYKANIALATTTLATKTTALAAQTAKAAASSGTYGFNAGLELDIDAIEKQLQEYQETSVASNLVATNININAGSKATIQGSNLNADKSINIDAKTTDILASKDISNSSTDTEHQNINLSLDMYSGANANISADKSKSNSDQLNHTNAQLQANNININTRETTTIQGANLNAAESLAINTNNLNISSVQNTTKTKSDSKGASAGFGADGLSSVGANSSNSRSNSKETLLTSITAKEVDINVEQETKLKGATISALDENGNDNSSLNLTTDTLIVSSLNNTYSSNSKSIGVNLGGSVKDNTASNISLEFSNDRTNTKTKTLATLGSGNIQVANTEDSDTKMLNRDIENNTVDIYDISSHKGLKGELDTNLLTEKGRDKIAEDLLKTNMIVNSIELIATTDRVGVEDFFSETDKTHKTYEAVKEKIAKSPELANALNNPDLTPTQKEQMLNDITGAVMIKLGYSENENRLIDTDIAGQNDEQVKGYISTETEASYINDRYNNSNEELVTTAGHEASSYIDMQEGKDITQNIDDNNVYSNNFGENLATYTNFALDVTEQGSMADSNTHKGVNILGPTVVSANNLEFSGLDKSVGDNAIYLYKGTVVATDGINDNKIIDLTFGESFEFREKDRVASLPDEVQIIEQKDTSEYENVYDLDNKDDFETLRATTDMNYDNINKDTQQVFWNGMMNTEDQATESQIMVNKDFPNTGLINNETGGVIDDVIEWSTNDLKTKDILNAYQLQQLYPSTTVITHSAGNEDIHKANEVNALVDAQTPYNLISVGSPTSLTDLENSTARVGANVIVQINHPNDPVPNGLVNEDANYEVKYGLEDLLNEDLSKKIPVINNLLDNHPFDKYYNNVVKDEITKAQNND